MCNFACVFAFYWIESYIRVRIQAIFHTKKQTFQDYLLLKLVHSSDTLHRGQFTIWNQNNFQVKYCNKLQDSCWIQEKHKQSFIEQHSKTSKISKYLMSNSMKLLLIVCIACSYYKLKLYCWYLPKQFLAKHPYFTQLLDTKQWI